MRFSTPRSGLLELTGLRVAGRRVNPCPLGALRARGDARALKHPG